MMETSEITLYAGIFCKLWAVPKRGTLLPQHVHQHSHISLIVQGEVRVWRDDECLGDFKAPAMIKIHAHAPHGFLALTDDVTIACIHNADQADSDGAPVVIAERQTAMED
jgi:quercetin dioxygenase-like cupin family protein